MRDMAGTEKSTQQYLGVIVVCHDVKPGGDDWSLGYRGGTENPHSQHDLSKQRFLF